MVPSDLSEPPRSEASKVRWFTEGETRWRTGAAIAWVMIILPCTLLISSAAASIDLFHPVNWISECLSLVLSFSFWTSVCFYCTVSVAVLLSYAKFNTVRDVIHQTQVAAILFPLHPARMFHMLLFTTCGSLSAWCFLGIIGGEEDYLTRLCETSEEFCLNEHLVFGILFGAWLGFYSSLKYFLKKEFHFVFPRVQQKRFFLIKMSLGSCIKQSIVQCVKACGLYYILYYLFGNIPRDALANMLDAPLDKSVTLLNTVYGLMNVSQFWHLLTTGSLILFVWTFGKRLLVIFHTQLYTFPVESSFSHQQDQSLCVVIKNKTVPLLKYLAMFDLCHLSQFSSTRRKQIFSLSQPSGRPDNWTIVSTECLSLIESLTTKLSAEVSLQVHLQQPPLDPRFLGPALTNGHANGHANGHVNGHAGQSPPVLSSPYQSPSSVSSVTRRQQSLSSPGAVHLWSEKTDSALKMPSPLKPRQDNSLISRVRNKTIDKVDDLAWRLNQVPHNIARRLKQRPIIGFLFDEIPEARTQAIFTDCQLHIWAVEVLSRLVAWSYTEDTFGVVQKSLPKIFVSLLNLLQALDQHSKLSLALTSKPEIQARPRQPQGYQLRTTLVSSIYRITDIFHEHLRNIPMAVEHEKKLESFLKFRE
ncbi:nucleoporin NDC1-like [Orbicella faveolata]|uniref:nucleoporin NDC1-like n=1 Tax=Orbicella faveolata TaxID=48498 RepID=UPI0009E604A9|nr:nucleoporin NDC1-like [Orbicella faveolata]